MQQPQQNNEKPNAARITV